MAISLIKSDALLSAATIKSCPESTKSKIAAASTDPPKPIKTPSFQLAKSKSFETQTRQKPHILETHLQNTHTNQDLKSFREKEKAQQWGVGSGKLTFSGGGKEN